MNNNGNQRYVQMSEQGRGFIRDTAISIFLVTTTIAAVVFSAVWYVSPLGLGFSEWPSEPGRRDLALTLFAISHRVGIPMLLIAQALAIVMAAKGYRRTALITPVLSLSVFSVCIATVLTLLN
jgi:small-conductance mechanosensitive channel